jgi:hypothetical protein
MRLRYSKGHRRVANNTQCVPSPSNFKSGNHINDALFYAFNPYGPQTKGNIQSKGWGILICDIHTEDIFRWIFQNSDGLYWRDATLHLENQAVSQLERLWCAGSGISETNTSLNSKGGQRRRRLKKIVDNKFKRSVFWTSNAEIPWEANYQPGGTLATVTGQWIQNVTQHGSDPKLGWWSWFTVKGKGTSQTTFITAYRVCD